MDDTDQVFQYEHLDRDLSELSPIERPCVLALLLCDRLGCLQVMAEMEGEGDVGRFGDSLAEGTIRAFDLLGRLSQAITTSVHVALREVHVNTDRKIRLSGMSYGSYCHAAEQIGRAYYRAIFGAADEDEWSKWLIANIKGEAGFKGPSADSIKEHWPEIAAAIVALPEVDWEDLDLGIKGEHIAVSGPPKQPLPIITMGLEAAKIQFDGSTFESVDLLAAEALKVILDSHPLPVGLTRAINSPAKRAVDKLPQKLRERVVSLSGNRGYIFKP